MGPLGNQKIDNCKAVSEVSDRFYWGCHNVATTFLREIKKPNRWRPIFWACTKDWLRLMGFIGLKLGTLKCIQWFTRSAQFDSSNTIITWKEILLGHTEFVIKPLHFNWWKKILPILWQSLKKINMMYNRQGGLPASNKMYPVGSITSTDMPQNS